MNWDAIGAIGEWAGAAAVIATLLYLGLQIRQTNNISRFSAAERLMARFDELNQMFASDSELLEVLLKVETLSKAEDERVYAIANLYCNIWVSAEQALMAGQIDLGFFNAIKRDVEFTAGRWPQIGSKIEQWVGNYPEMRTYEIFETRRNKSG